MDCRRGLSEAPLVWRGSQAQHVSGRSCSCSTRARASSPSFPSQPLQPPPPSPKTPLRSQAEMEERKAGGGGGGGRGRGDSSSTASERGYPLRKKLWGWRGEQRGGGWGGRHFILMHHRQSEIWYWQSFNEDGGEGAGGEERTLWLLRASEEEHKVHWTLWE